MLKEVPNNVSLKDDLEEKVAIVNSYPSVMYIESTRGCPYKCAMCNVPDMYGRKSRDIDHDLLTRLEPYYKHLKVLGIHCAGEPLLSRELDYFIKKSAEHDFYLHANTTGFYLKDSMSDRLLKAKLHFMFSIHAGSAQSYKRIMGNDFNRVMKNITYLVQQSAEVGHKDNEFWFSYIVVKENVDEILDFLDLAHDIGISRVQFMGLKPNKKTLKGFYREEEDFHYKYFEQFNAEVRAKFLENLPKYRERAQKLGISIEMGSMEFAAKHKSNMGEIVRKVQKKLMPSNNIFPLIERKGDCIVPWVGQIQVKQDGEVNLCCSTHYPIGNLFKESLDDMWNGERMQAIRTKFQSGRIPRVCGNCRGVDLDEYGVDLI